MCEKNKHVWIYFLNNLFTTDLTLYRSNRNKVKLSEITCTNRIYTKYGMQRTFFQVNIL